MPLMRKVMETVVQFLPAKDPDPLVHRHGYIGRDIDRVDGPLKVRGEARFTAEFQIENLAHAVLVHSSVPRGRIVSIDTTEAERSPGFIAVVTHHNAPKMKKPTLLNVNNLGKGVGGSDLPIMQDATIHYDGEAVAVVIAETLEQAEHAASLVRVIYEMETPRVSFDGLKAEAELPSDVLQEDPEVERGDAVEALEQAAFKVDNIYRTPRHNHNALEMHATIAFWDDEDHL